MSPGIGIGISMAFTPHRPWLPLWLGPALWLRADLGVTFADYWQNVVNVTVAGTSITKTAGANGWNAGASTSQALLGDGHVEFTTDTTASNKVCGLSHGDPGATHGEIDFALTLIGNSIQVWENNVHKGDFGTFVPGDLFRVQVIASVVTYWRNGVLLYTSLNAPTFPLLVDTSLFQIGGSIQNVTLTGAVSKVSTWADQSGNARDVSQATVAKRPYLETGPPAGLRFVAADSCALYRNVAISLITAYTTMAVSQKLANTGTGQGLLCNGHNDGSMLFHDDAYLYDHHLAEGLVGTPDATFERAHWDSQWDGTNLRLRRNSGGWVAAVRGMLAPTTSLSVGSAYGGAAYPLDGLIHEIVLVDRVLTATELAQFSAYCQARYGVS